MSEPLDVAFLIDRWDPERGGAERALAALARHLERSGHRVRAFARDGRPGAPGELERVRPGIALRRGARERRLGNALVAAAEAWGADVTVGIRHLPRVDLYWPHGGVHAVTHAATREARAWRPDRLRVDDVAPLRGRHRAFAELESALLDHGGARAVACVSKLVEAELVRVHPEVSSRAFLAENGVDLERFHPREREASGARLRRELAIGARDPLVVFCGRNAVLKGLPVLIEALARSRGRWTLLIAGPKDADAWAERAAAACGDRERVRALVHADGAALAAAADVVAVPTWRDPCSLVLLEALASGTPVVATTRAGACDVIRTGEQGRVVEPGDAGALLDAIEALLETGRDAVDRGAVRAAVIDRGAEPWLACLEAKLVELAGSRVRS